MTYWAALRWSSVPSLVQISNVMEWPLFKVLHYCYGAERAPRTALNPNVRKRATMADLEQEAASLRQRNQQRTDFLENVPFGLHLVGGDGTILWANQAELDALGYLKEEYVGHHIAEFHADSPVIQDILERLQARETLRIYRARLRAKDGSIRYVVIDSIILSNGDCLVVTTCTTKDVSDRLAARLHPPTVWI
jgi:PAS domain S-box-containing protein